MITGPVKLPGVDKRSLSRATPEPWFTMAPAPYSDLEVAPSTHRDSTLEVYEKEGGNDTYKEAHESHAAYYGVAETPTSDRASRRICGLPAKRFWLIAAVVAIVIIAAAVGGGVGGSLAGKGSSSSASASESAASVIAAVTGAGGSSSSSSIIASITSAPTPTKSIVTTSTAFGTTTLYPDCPSSNDTIYRAANNDAYLYRKICGDAYLNADNGFPSVNEQSRSLDACINLCTAYNIAEHADIASGAKPVCNAVCWRATIENDDYPGQCFGFRTQNSSSDFVLSGDNRCDSAAWINQSF